jgi:hypothetical protein
MKNDRLQMKMKAVRDFGKLRFGATPLRLLVAFQLPFENAQEQSAAERILWTWKP